ncbi:hypothetical protein AHF37_02398 [Paragonimus kellicotti]|nr:hypothetical protein AHF37_02398 [Paragonimus kellicotti]
MSQKPRRHRQHCAQVTDTMSDEQRNPAEMRSSAPPDDAVSNTSSLVGTFDPDELLTFGAKQIISLFVPVTVCMFFVVLVATTVDFYARTDVYLIYTPFHTPDADLGTRTWQTLANTLIFMSVIVVMTCILVVLFKYHCYRVIHGWLILTTFMLLFLISFLFFTSLNCNADESRLHPYRTAVGRRICFMYTPTKQSKRRTARCFNQIVKVLFWFASLR